ncbi:NnrU family protein [uncultured Roseibium sp.]|uniref:NnrU family protein n=1 Tax=uncultured Roseibium sp. TaxID=1936171 RepID=UPI00374A4342
MSLLVLGLLVFLGAHALPIFSGVRNALVARLGAKPYRGLFSRGLRCRAGADRHRLRTGAHGWQSRRL